MGMGASCAHDSFFLPALAAEFLWLERHHRVHLVFDSVDACPGREAYVFAAGADGQRRVPVDRFRCIAVTYRQLIRDGIPTTFSPWPSRCDPSTT